MATPSFGRTAWRTAGVCLGLIASLTIVEAGLRITNYPYSRWLGVSDPVLHHVHPPGVEYAVHDHDPPHVIRYDEEGLPFDPALRIHNPSAHVRLALMGDSFVEAVDVPYRESLAGRLEAQAAPDVEIRNFGTWSYSPVLYVVQWRKVVRAFRPTDVVLVLFNNDVADDARYYALAKRTPDGDVDAVPAPGQTGLRGAIGRSRAARLAAYSLGRLLARWRPEETAEWSSVEEAPDLSPLTARMLLTFAREIHTSGANLFLTAVPSRRRTARQPGPDPDFSAKCRAWAEANGVRFVDLSGAFLAASLDGPPLTFPEDFHWTAAGHAAAAGALRAELPHIFDRE